MINIVTKNLDKIHHSLSGFPPTQPLMRFLAYLKNDFMKPKFEDRLIDRMVDGWQKMKILDLGCGPGRRERDRRFRGVDICGVDIYKPYLETCQNYGFKTLHADIREIGKHFPENSWDIIWLFDVVEHLEKQDGLKVLKQAEKIARRQVIIWTPRGKVPQDILSDGNCHQKHLSSWDVADFRRRGYMCEILPNYHPDIRNLSRELSLKRHPISADAFWAIFLKEKN